MLVLQPSEFNVIHRDILIKNIYYSTNNPMHDH